MKKNIITIKHKDRGYIARVKYSIKKNDLSLDFIESNFYSKYSKKQRYDVYAGRAIFYLSRKQHKSSINCFNFKEMKSYIHNLQNGIPRQDRDGEWYIRINI